MTEGLFTGAIEVPQCKKKKKKIDDNFQAALKYY